jgi:hypothetical protein
MFPTMCEITFACMISYYFALFVMERVRRVSKQAITERAVTRQTQIIDRRRRCNQISQR